MDPASIIGLVVSFGAVFASIIMEGASPTSIILIPPMLLVIGGTLGAGLTASTLKDAIRSFSALPKALTAKAPDLGGTVETIVSLADRARREGLLALEDAAKEVENEFLRSGLQTAIDGTDPEDLRAMLEDQIAAKRAQEKVISKYFADMGGFAPTVGIIGTVVSLVHVLGNLSDPSTLGPLIASAFVATLWGLMTANLIWLPLSGRIKRITELECMHMEIAVEGLLAIQSGANPRTVGARLRSLMPPGTAKEAA